MAGCERCALKRRIREREKKKEKRKGKRGKNGDQNRFFFFYKSTRRFFHMRSGHLSNI